MSDDYRVQLDIYNGPLDLLLYLIRREEVDIYDIPIVKITEQYTGYVDVLREIDPNAAGEFLVLASMLMEIKSRMLLPRPPAESEEEFVDPRLELVRQLLEYKRFKDAAHELRAAAEEHALRFARQPQPLDPEGERDIEMDSLHLWDLVEAFREVMAKIGRFAPHEVHYDDTPVALHAADVVDRLEREGGSMEFIEIFEGRTRSECIGLFLALLELVRQRRVRAEQDAPFAPIFLHLMDATPIDEPEEAPSFFAVRGEGEEQAAAEAPSQDGAEAAGAAADVGDGLRVVPDETELGEVSDVSGVPEPEASPADADGSSLPAEPSEAPESPSAEPGDTFDPPAAAGPPG